MTVKELIETLQDYNPDAKVLLMTQQQWPFENILQGVVERREMLDFAKENGTGIESDLEEGANLDDVFLVEGHQMRYGNKDAWEAVAFGCLH